MNPIKVIDAGLVPYGVAYEWQKQLHTRRVAHSIPDSLLLLEHPHVYTLGRRFAKEHLLLSEEALATKGIEVFEADRGGSITYHGPGQLVGYPILDLRKPSNGFPESQPDVIVYLRRLEEAIIRAARSFGVVAGRRAGLTGVWVGETKLAAIGVNVSRGVTKHGFAINVSTDLSYYDGMIPCGIPEATPTSLERILQRPVQMDAVAEAMVQQVGKVLYRFPISGALGELGLNSGGTESGEVIPIDERRAAGS